MRKGVITGRINLKDGMGKWLGGITRLVTRRGREVRPQVAAAAVRPEPVTEAERSLYQAMGWKDSAWED